MINVQLTELECEALAEQIDIVLDSAEDWQLEEKEHNETVEFWLNLLLKLGQTEKEEEWRKDLLPNK